MIKTSPPQTAMISLRKKVKNKTKKNLRLLHPPAVKNKPPKQHQTQILIKSKRLAFIITKMKVIN
jgi:hypothetical protein